MIIHVQWNDMQISKIWLLDHCHGLASTVALAFASVSLDDLKLTGKT